MATGLQQTPAQDNRSEGQQIMSTEQREDNLHLPSLSIRGFRGIGDLSIPKLARVTLIAGMNDTGKTSILEGVRLLMEGATPEVIGEILQFREQDTEAFSNDGESPSSETFLLSALFHGFPQLSECSDPIVISCGDNSHQIHLQVGWFSEIIEEDGSTRLIPAETDPPGEHANIPALIVTTGKNRRVYNFGRIDRFASTRRARFRSNQRRVSSRLVNASGQDRTAMLGPLWDNISITEQEPHVVEALRIIDPQISAVSMVGEQSLSSARTAVVRSDNFGRRVPLHSFGDGMNRLFGIILSLVNVDGGVLLIDEFENGMHYTVQLDVWRMVFRLAEDLNVQVLATTHSLDCVAGFRQAAAEREKTEGLLLRIDRIGDRMRAVEYTEEDLRIAIAQRIEIR